MESTPARTEVVIATAVESVARDFVSLAGALTPDSRFTLQVGPVAIHDEFSRFKLWAGNIAAHRRGRRSLEYRLRDATQLRAQTHNLLESLSETLHRALKIALGEETPWDELSDSDEDSDSGHSDDETSSSGTRGSTELKQLLDSIKTLVTSLFRLSMAIRDPAPNDQARSPIVADKSVYEEHDVRHVQAKFTDSPAYISERLGRAITARRQYLSHREQHQQKLAKHVEKIGYETTVTEFTTNSTEATPLPLDHRTNSVSVNVLDGEDDIVSQTSYATSVNATLHVPPLPKEAHKSDFFECPLCFRLLSIHSIAAWKQHVFRDLHPYCCTYEQCIIADRLYDTRKTWFAHELEAHRTTWQCVEGCSKIFQLLRDFENHVQKSHPDLASKNMLSILGRTSEKRAEMHERVRCTLCHKVMTLRALQKHMGNHQQQLALFALPPCLDETEDDIKDENNSFINQGKYGKEEVPSDSSDTSDLGEPEEDSTHSDNDENNDAGLMTAKQRMDIVRSDWDFYVQGECEAFLSHPPETSTAAQDIYDNLKRLIHHQISLRIPKKSDLSIEPLRADTLNEVEKMLRRMRDVINGPWSSHSSIPGPDPMSSGRDHDSKQVPEFSKKESQPLDPGLTESFPADDEAKVPRDAAWTGFEAELNEGSKHFDESASEVPYTSAEMAVSSKLRGIDEDILSRQSPEDLARRADVFVESSKQSHRSEAQELDEEIGQTGVELQPASEDSQADPTIKGKEKQKATAGGSPLLSRPINTSESWPAYHFEIHARKCAYCHDPYEVHRDHEQLCDVGHRLAQEVARFLYRKSDGKTYSTIEEDDTPNQVELPAGYVEIQSLLKAIERSLRHRSRKPFVSMDRSYYVAPKLPQRSRSVKVDQDQDSKPIKTPHPRSGETIDWPDAKPTSKRVLAEIGNSVDSKRGSLYEEDLAKRRAQVKDYAVEVREPSAKDLREHRHSGYYR